MCSGKVVVAMIEYWPGAAILIFSGKLRSICSTVGAESGEASLTATKRGKDSAERWSSNSNVAL